MTAAMAKAKSLHLFATSRGAPLGEFQVALTDTEAFEVIDSLIHDVLVPNELLELDAAEARRTGNPWLVLDHFCLLGLKLAPALALH